MHKEARLKTNEKLTKTVQTGHPRAGEEPIYRHELGRGWSFVFHHFYPTLSSASTTSYTTALFVAEARISLSVNYHEDGQKSRSTMEERG
jgi:hypothetical protein